MGPEPSVQKEDLVEIGKEVALNRNKRVKGGKSQKRKRLKKEAAKKTKKRKRRRGKGQGTAVHQVGQKVLSVAPKLVPKQHPLVSACFGTAIPVGMGPSLAHQFQTGCETGAEL